MVVYVVTYGQWSDYQLLGIFSTREKAMEYVNQIKDSSLFWYNEIEEWEVDKPTDF